GRGRRRPCRSSDDRRRRRRSRGSRRIGPTRVRPSRRATSARTAQASGGAPNTCGTRTNRGQRGERWRGRNSQGGTLAGAYSITGSQVTTSVSAARPVGELEQGRGRRARTQVVTGACGAESPLTRSQTTNILYIKLENSYTTSKIFYA